MHALTETACLAAFSRYIISHTGKCTYFSKYISNLPIPSHSVYNALPTLVRLSKQKPCSDCLIRTCKGSS